MFSFWWLELEEISRLIIGPILPITTGGGWSDHYHTDHGDNDHDHNQFIFYIWLINVEWTRSSWRPLTTSSFFSSSFPSSNVPRWPEPARRVDVMCPASPFQSVRILPALNKAILLHKCFLLPMPTSMLVTIFVASSIAFCWCRRRDSGLLLLAPSRKNLAV